MRTKVIIAPTPDGFVLRTESGYPVGQRMLSLSPKKGSDWPVVPDAPFATEMEAHQAKLDWNMYLLHVSKTKTKKSRISE